VRLDVEDLGCAGCLRSCFKDFSLLPRVAVYNMSNTDENCVFAIQKLSSSRCPQLSERFSQSKIEPKHIACTCGPCQSFGKYSQLKVAKRPPVCIMACLQPGYPPLNVYIDQPVTRDSVVKLALCCSK
jgi:hypothetical protein